MSLGWFINNSRNSSQVLYHVVKQENGNALTGQLTLVIHLNYFLQRLFNLGHISDFLVRALYWIEF